ncbi:S-layer homology domain-containing protein [Flavonifractor sp. AGMB03687]|uniref:S-layer homology domain-containing protein n=1 Tax=Flavonifractor sp. AGMB03687 TaxID=2785133 RepID=UPI001AE0E11E|nr:S-layer homology domain-containing protein [Flavonifractor sp. AGMB03687]
MRNLKRVLSLALAALMLMGMMVVGAGAASKDFTDADEITNVEAVDVMVALGVLEGGDKGDFQPNSILTREQAAKIICYLLLGEEAAEKLTTNYPIFSDVPANRWSAPYISYCVNLGILAGDGAGHFYPEGKLTGVAFAKMLLVGLGYSAEREHYVGNNWEINVSAAAIATGVAPKGLVLSNELSRQDAAQMAYNTLQATMVEYLNDNTIIIGDTTVSTVGKASAVKQAPYTDTMDQENLQFAEKYFSNLKKKDVKDVFGRPSTNWVYGKTDIGTYVNSDLMVEEFTTQVTGKDLYDLIGANIIKDYDLTVAIDGVTDHKINSNVFNATQMNKNNKAGVGATDDAVLTQVFVDPSNEEITVAIINTYLAIADGDYSEKKDEASFTVYAIDEKSGEYIKDTAKTSSFDVSGEDFDVAEVVDGDAMLVTVADGEIQSIDKAEILADTEITAFKTGSSVTVDGTKYGYASTAMYDTEVLDQYTDSKVNLKDVTYNVYLVTMGGVSYLIGIDLVEVPNNYVFIAGVDYGSSNLSNKTADASAIFVDGTSKVIEVDMTKNTAINTALKQDPRVNTWFTYTVNKDGVYTLKQVAGSITSGVKVAQYHEDVDDKEINKKNVSLTGAASGDYKRVYGNDSSVYLVADLKNITDRNGAKTTIISGVETVNTGVKNTNLTTMDEAAVKSAMSTGYGPGGTYTLYKSNGYVIASVVVGEDDAASKNLVYVHSGSVAMESYDKTADEWTWTRKVVSNGEEIEIKEVGDALTYLDEMKKDNWYQVKYNADGEVIGVNAETASGNIGTWDLTTATSSTAGTYVNNIDYVEKSINAEDNVLYSQSFTDEVKEPQLKGSTLYVTTTKDTGFFVDENVKLVLVQTNDRKTTTTFETGVKELEDVMAQLNKATDGKYDYTVSAILEDGAATTVIVVDANDETGNSGTNKPVIKGDYEATVTPKINADGSIGFSAFTCTEMNGYVLKNAVAEYTVIMNGKEYTAKQTLGTVNYSDLTTKLAVPGITVKNGTEIEVQVVVTWESNNPGEAGIYNTVSGTGYIF